MRNKTRWYGWETADKEKCIFTSTKSTCDTSPNASLKITEPFSLPPAMRKSSSSIYFTKKVLRVSPELGDFGGGPSWWMMLSIFVVWCVNFACLFNGIQTSGKVVYFSATFPYLILVILLVMGVIQTGAGDGLYYLFVPDWEKIQSFTVWRAAAGQVEAADIE